jgi:hypothetical protein
MKYLAELLKISKQLNELSTRMKQLDQKLSEIIMIHSNVNLKINVDLLSLPHHLQETVLALGQIGRGTASDVALRTGKTRALESSYLNQLATQQYVMKLRNSGRSFDRSLDGREVIFCLRTVK